VKVVHTYFGLARQAGQLLQSAPASLSGPARPTPRCPDRVSCSQLGAAPAIAADQATAIYQTWMHRWQITERFAPPDWSIVDLWIARALLAQGWPPDQVQTILRLGSPQFPRRHGNPDDYLRRTVARAAFPPPQRTVWTGHARASSRRDSASTCSNSTGGRYPSAECSRFWL
jgi:hypothetical protein